MKQLSLSDELYSLLQGRAQQQGLSLESWLQEMETQAIDTDFFLLQQFYRRSADLFMILDFSFHIIKANPKFYQTVGYAEEELKTIPAMNLVYPEDFGKTQEAVKVVWDGGRVEGFEHRILTK